ncbi:hypothetical protein HY498_04685 [Candidatus Woesearchaeota archaeon]|nr:hypothetical protein [Candidatus Woesearchaeota archaeon]
MTNLTLAVPEILHKRLSEHPEMKWSEVARQAFEKKLEEFELEEKIIKRIKLTEKDAEVIGNKLKSDIRKRFE